MIKQKYSDLPFNNFDAAIEIINSCLPEDDPQIGLDIGDKQTAIFEIRMLDDDEFYLKESVDTLDGITVDEDTRGQYSIDQLIEIIIARLQILDDLTYYPRLATPVKDAIKAAKAVTN